MTVRHIAGRDDWYAIIIDRADEGSTRPGWLYRSVSVHGPNVEASAEWSLLDNRYRFGVGAVVGWNGDESDIGLDVHLSRIGNLYLRARAPFTRWARRSDYGVRHTGVELAPYDGCYLRVRVGHAENFGRREHGREWQLTRHAVWGRRLHESTVVAAGMCTVPMTEGNYPATWEQKRTTWRHVRWPGKALDWFVDRSNVSVWVEVPGGIPCEGKGENSWDCGMDGVFGTGGPTLEAAIANVVRAVMRERERNGGPHDLTEPMTVSEAERRNR